MARVRMRKGVNVSRVVKKLVTVLIALWVGGTVVNEVGEVMNGTTSPFYDGLSLIGWTVNDGLISDTSGSGILTVIGIIGIASIVMEFIQFSY